MKIKILWAICFMMILVSCREDDEIATTICEDIPPATGISAWGYQWTATVPYYDLPCFNPSNPNEIILRRYGGTTDSVFQLIKYNLSTEEKETIFEGDFGPRPRWSRKGWILLSMRDFNIYKIKSNGDSLTQLTFSEAICLGGEWNWSGDKFMYQFVRSNGNWNIICDEGGVSLDTITEWSSLTFSWQQGSLITSSNYYGVIVYDPVSAIVEQIAYEGEGIARWRGAEWLDDENVIWANVEGIFTANIVSKQIYQLKESCDAEFYGYPTVSQISRKILFSREDKTVTDENKGVFTRKLFMMNYDGSGEVEIVIPE